MKRYNKMFLIEDALDLIAQIEDALDLIALRIPPGPPGARVPSS